MAVQDLLEAWLLGPRLAWMVDGKCKGSAPEGGGNEDDPNGIVWYPERSNGAVQRAKSICNGTDATGIVCSVKDQCLEYALANDEYGVWGGTSERERRRIKKARRLAAVPVKISA